MQPLISLASLLITLVSLILATIIPAAHAASYSLNENRDLVGTPRVVLTHFSDSFVSLAKKHNVSFNELAAANPDLDPWLPGAGKNVLIPTQHILPQESRSGVVINLAELRLYYFPKEKEVVYTFPVGIGKEGWHTPVGNTQVIAKKKNPTWRAPKSIIRSYAAKGKFIRKVVPPGKDNPLGKYALRLGLPGYLIHGTNNEGGVGRRASHGCIRMYNQDIEMLFTLVPTGTPVKIVHQPTLIGQSKGKWYLQAHAPHSEYQQAWTEQYKKVLSQLKGKLANQKSIDWGLIKLILNQPTGLPIELSNF